MNEIWKPIDGHGGQYEVSNQGRVRSRERIIPAKILKLQHTDEGYVRVHLSGKGRKCASVHALVLAAFKGYRPEGQVARHMDGVRHNNVVDNLEWGTPKENVADRKRHGTYFQGERHHNSKLTDSDVRTIRGLATTGLSKVAIASRFDNSPANIGHIVKRKSWTHI